jgi:hypothetical protein
MSSPEEENEILDLRKMEDVFACLEAVAMAQAMLSSVDPDTAAELEKVTAALGALALLIDQGDLVQVVEKTVEVAGGGAAEAAPAQAPLPPVSEERGISDLVEFFGGGKGRDSRQHNADREDDRIVDILTGETIR